MCDRTYLFRAQGWESVNGLWFLMALIPTCVIILMTWPIETDGEEILLIEKICGGHTERLAYFLAFAFARTAGILSAVFAALVTGLYKLFLHICTTICRLYMYLRRMDGKYRGY